MGFMLWGSSGEVPGLVRRGKMWVRDFLVVSVGSSGQGRVNNLGLASSNNFNGLLCTGTAKLSITWLWGD